MYMKSIEQMLNLDGYVNDRRAARRKTGKNTQEFFTPYEIIRRMCSKISDDDWADPDKSFFEPCFGNGQFIVYIVYERIRHDVDHVTALNTLFGVELMQDNVIETHDRVLDLLRELNIDFDEQEVAGILTSNLRCDDFFRWVSDEWKPVITDVNMMKPFDFALMNPPYDNRLHLKFLEGVYEICHTVISIQPSDNFTNMNCATRQSNVIARHVDELEVYTADEMNRRFGIKSSSNLGIFTLKAHARGHRPEHDELRDVVRRIRRQKSIRSSLNMFDNKPCVMKPFYTHVQGDYGYAKIWHYTLEQIFVGTPHAMMGFDTQRELDNFLYVTKNCWPYRLMYVIDDHAAVIAHLPFMQDYTRRWTDADFYEYFDVTHEEKMMIERLLSDDESV